MNKSLFIAFQCVFTGVRSVIPAGAGLTKSCNTLGSSTSMQDLQLSRLLNGTFLAICFIGIKRILNFLVLFPFSALGTAVLFVTTESP